MANFDVLFIGESAPPVALGSRVSIIRRSRSPFQPNLLKQAADLFRMQGGVHHHDLRQPSALMVLSLVSSQRAVTSGWVAMTGRTCVEILDMTLDG